MSKKKKDKKTNKKKRKIEKAIGIAIFILLFVVIGISMRGSEPDDETPVEEIESVESDSKSDDTELAEDDSIGTEDEFIDERPAVEGQTLDDIKSEAYEYASNGQWNELIILIDKYDKEYDLEKSDEGEHLRDIYWDAMIISRLEQMGDDENAIIAGVEKIPNLKTVEMYVWALYFLPRNNIVDLSSDSLALAPTARGKVELKNVQNSQYDVELYNEMLEDEYIKSYINSADVYNSGGDGYFRVDLSNYGVEETVYGLIRLGGGYELIGIYSSDEYYSNHAETVDHFRRFSERVSEGLDEINNN